MESEDEVTREMILRMPTCIDWPFINVWPRTNSDISKLELNYSGPRPKMVVAYVKFLSQISWY